MRMEWNGVEWSGMEWNGVEWSGMEWNGVEWSGMEWNACVWRCAEMCLGHGPGAPVVDSAGPLFPALDTNTTLCRFTRRSTISTYRPEFATLVYSP